MQTKYNIANVWKFKFFSEWIVKKSHSKSHITIWINRVDKKIFRDYFSQMYCKMCWWVKIVIPCIIGTVRCYCRNGAKRETKCRCDLVISVGIADNFSIHFRRPKIVKYRAGWWISKKTEKIYEKNPSTTEMYWWNDAYNVARLQLKGSYETDVK